MVNEIAAREIIRLLVDTRVTMMFLYYIFGLASFIN